MRTITLALLVFGLGSVVAADAVLTQKATVAPSVAPGETPKPPAAVVAGWEDRFSAGPQPLWIWGSNPDTRYLLRGTFDAPGVTAAKVKFTSDNHVKLSLNGKEVGTCDEWQD